MLRPSHCCGDTPDHGHRGSGLKQEREPVLALARAQVLVPELVPAREPDQAMVPDLDPGQALAQDCHQPQPGPRLPCPRHRRR